MTEQTAAPEAWMLHDMEFATVVTVKKPGLFIAHCDGKFFTREENLAHAELIIADRGAAAERDRLRNLVQVLLDNDPADDAADGVTVLDVWRREARAVLAEGRKPKGVGCLELAPLEALTRLIEGAP